MKGAINTRLIFALGLLAIWGEPELAAAQGPGDGQEQARLLLAGRGAASSAPGTQVVSPSSIVARSIAVDAQEQARSMILGPQAKTSVIEVDGVRAAAQHQRELAADPQESARQMILGSLSAQSVAKIRLTSKSEKSELRSEEAP
jgi:hypothetical protein